MSGRQFGGRHGGAVERAHDALREKEVAEERGEKEVLSEQFVKEIPRKRIPGDRIRDGGEYPIQLAEHRPPIAHLTWVDIVN